VTDSARARLEEVLEEQEEAVVAVERPRASMEIARLTKDDIGSRPMALLGAYGVVTPLVRLVGSDVFFLSLWLDQTLASITCAGFIPDYSDVL
jgi:hypothetical protein